MRKFTAKLFLLATLTLAVTAVPAMAEEEMGQESYRSGLGPFTYNVVQYPSHNSNFFFYPESYVEFDAKNGKYWMFEVSYFNMSNVTSRNPVNDLWGMGLSNSALTSFDVKFYSPDGKLLGSFNNVDVNSPFSVPRDGEKYDHVKVRIESHSQQNLDGRFMVWDPVDAVVASPIKDCPDNTRSAKK